MYIVSSFRGGATVKSNIFFVIVFESQKPPHLNGKWGCGRWMEECGRGAAVEQLTARGMEYQSPRWGTIAVKILSGVLPVISIPAMGGQ